MFNSKSAKVHRSFAGMKILKCFLDFKDFRSTYLCCVKLYFKILGRNNCKKTKTFERFNEQTNVEMQTCTSLSDLNTEAKINAISTKIILLNVIFFC